jgi:hypothetical protein
MPGLGPVMVWLLGPALLGCAGSPPAAEDAAVSTIAALPAERLDATWVVTLAEEASIGAYAQEPGWVALVMKRDYAGAVRGLGPKGGLAAARAHADAAALYRQAALLAASSLVEVYGETPEPSDPAGAAHLLTVSYAITGRLDEAKAADAKLPAGDPTEKWHAPWRAWLAAGATWPPDLSGLPIALPPPAPGEWPELADLPHYSLPEQAGSKAKRDMADPGALLAVALWHDQVAAEAAGADAAKVAEYRAGYRLPVEPDVAAAGDLPIELLFGSDHLVPGDAAFLADLSGTDSGPGGRTAKGAAAVDAHAATSLLAQIALMSRKDGKVDAETAIDVITRMREDLVARASARTGGNVLAHQRIFADVAYVGALRSLALVAEVEGDHEASGKLRINAFEHSDKATADPVGLLAFAAWDAANRYPLRALDILHAQARRYPTLEIARYGLDVLGLRVSNERTGETPGM